jgi:hypothetical protein
MDFAGVRVNNPEKHFRVITSGEAITLKVKI